MRKLLPVFFMLAASLILRTMPAAGQLDHLICYDVKDKLKPGVVVDLKTELQPEFRQAGCTVVKVTKFCVPTTKVVLPPAPAGPNIVGQPLQNDYVCYQIDCPNTGPRIADKLVIDQFGQRRERKFKPKELCVPARKASPPCFRIGTSKKCGGVCPNDPAGGTSCRFDETLQDCTCAPEPCGGKPDKTGHCGGECPDPLTCQPGINAAGNPECICGDPPPPPCGLNPATGTCGGTCDDPAALCVLVTTTNGFDCICQPPDPGCHKDTAGVCGGPCPAPLTCVLDPVIADCRCETPPLPCGPNSLGQCGGFCATGSECRFVNIPGTTPSCQCVTP